MDVPNQRIRVEVANAGGGQPADPPTAALQQRTNELIEEVSGKLTTFQQSYETNVGNQISNFQRYMIDFGIVPV